MNCSEAVILAGGFGTRLQSVVSGIPKPMAQVGDKPFLYYVLNYLNKFEIKRVVLSVGYCHNTIIEYFGNRFGNMELDYAIENEPLGTGGAVKYATKYIKSESFLLLNGDSFFKSDLKQLVKFHKQNNSKITLSLKELKNFDRYGSVKINRKGLVTQFSEKKICDIGLINTGVYVVDSAVVKSFNTEKFSFEKDILEKEIDNKTIYGIVSDGYFIDIGIPQDYEIVQNNISELL